MKRQTERVIYTGRVQGVGFRYTTRNLAKRHPVAGYVKNLPEGTVELVVQGEPHAINAFLLDIADQFHGHIVRVDRTASGDGEDDGEIYTVFDIRF